MRDFVLMTDSCCDMAPQMAEELGLIVLPLSLELGGATYHNYRDGREIGFSDFYSRIRSGETATTSAISVGTFEEAMRPVLESGRDILCLSFSSALSTTYQSAVIAAGEMREAFPEAKVHVVGTLCASLGQGLLVYLCALQKQAGKSLEELRDYAENTKGRICHWFTVDDLNHLKRGGRVSAATALFGTMLSIKPVLHVDDEGHLISMGKARGRGASLTALVDHMEKTVTDVDTVFISHGDCLADAEKVAADVKKRFGTKDVVINNVGPVIGAHSGPGTLALFFLGTKR